ncbi:MULTISPECIES: hypothetical protein [unclassified Undibacterium]|uniref:hypothetical protein n=1 Tax=unclassified Undibacterium TaxID=2630295 RepID=UPI0033935A5C
MSRITTPVLARSIQQVRAMTLVQKEQLLDNMFRSQPTLLIACLVQHKIGIPFDKMEFLMELIFICFQSMKESGLTWSLIDENQWERQLGLLVANVKFTERLSSDLRRQSLHQYIDDHPEKMLFVFVMSELLPWLDQCGLAEDNERYVMLAAITAVNCIANMPMPPMKKTKK